MNNPCADRSLRLPTLLCLLALSWLQPASLSVAYAEAPLAAQHGVVVLRNGHVLQGKVVRLGDRYLIALGASGEIGLAVEDVQFVCRDMEHAFRQKLSLVESGNVRQHLELAHWCLRHSLLSHTAEEIRVVSHLDPMNPNLASLERRLIAAAQAPLAPAAAIAAPPTRPKQGLSEQLMDQLTAATVEHFTHRVQPLLLNRCGAANCHGPVSNNGFRLTRSPFGGTMTRPLTQRNLVAVVQQINRNAPDRSPLLQKIAAPHGTAKGPIFPEYQQQRYDDLALWVNSLAKPAPQPATIAVEQANLAQAARAAYYQPVQQGAPTNSQIIPAAATEPRQTTPGQEPAPFAQQATDKELPTEPTNEAGKPITTNPVRFGADRQGFQPRDPFDPEIFNRRYFPAENDAPPTQYNARRN